jgi:hypothetical protein
VVPAHGSRYLRLLVGRGHTSVRYASTNVPESAVLMSWFCAMFLGVVHHPTLSPGDWSAFYEGVGIAWSSDQFWHALQGVNVQPI